MKEPLLGRLAHAWDVFRNPKMYTSESGSSRRQDRQKSSTVSEKSLMVSVFNRISVDVAALSFKHVKLDDNDRISKVMKSALNSMFTLEANIDQTGRAFLQDIVYSMCDEGAVAVVPTDTDINPDESEGYDILSARVGKIVEWYPKKVKVYLYNDDTGRFEYVIVDKKTTAIIENPFYSIMNEPNSVLKRLARKLQLMDQVDERVGANKLDMVIQLPFTIKTETRRQQAENRRTELENQLSGSKYGVGYTDATEKIIQLNRPIENAIAPQVKDLKNDFFNQLGTSETVFNGTADEKTMINYHNRVVAVFADAIIGEFIRKFLSKTARTQKQTIMYFRDPFKLVPVEQIAEIADKFTRNEIMTSNEFRGTIGLPPADDERADMLLNKNNISGNPSMTPTDTSAQDVIMENLLGSLEGDIDKILGGNDSG
jgi:hypothetical protein